MKIVGRVDSNFHTCACSGKHVPKPLTLYLMAIGADTVAICPTSYENVQEFTRALKRGYVPGSVRKHFSKYIQELAQRAVDEGEA